ncbi:MAG TPA: hypothetical protein VGV64_04005 [Thermoplasmata archaeon]|nr:hypothetical protein [Thermoplasmata archaeon]
MLRRAIPAEAPRLARWLAEGIAEDEPEAGWDPDRLARTIERLHRPPWTWPLEILSSIGRPIGTTIVDVEGDRLLGAASVAFGRGVAHLAAWCPGRSEAAPAIARELLAAARAAAAPNGPKGLLVSLPPGAGASSRGRVLVDAGARRLVETSRFAFATSDGSRAPGSPGPVRRATRRDVEPLLRLLRAGRPPALESLDPVGPSAIRLSPLVPRVFGSVSETFVVDDAGGPVAFVRATVSEAARAGHLTEPIGPGGDAPTTVAVVRAALGWLAERGRPKAIGSAWRVGPAGGTLKLPSFAETLDGAPLYHLAALGG